jgi:hypothetical protein
MKLSIEKKPMNSEESYFVLSSGEKRLEMTVNAVKAVLLMWVFFATVMFTFIIGQQTVYQGQMMNIYLMKGNLTNEKGEPVTCDPILNAKRSLEWNCTIQNLTEAR